MTPYRLALTALIVSVLSATGALAAVSRPLPEPPPVDLFETDLQIKDLQAAVSSLRDDVYQLTQESAGQQDLSLIESRLEVLARQVDDASAQADAAIALVGAACEAVSLLSESESGFGPPPGSC